MTHMLEWAVMMKSVIYNSPVHPVKVLQSSVPVKYLIKCFVKCMCNFDNTLHCYDNIKLCSVLFALVRNFDWATGGYSLVRDASFLCFYDRTVFRRNSPVIVTVYLRGT